MSKMLQNFLQMATFLLLTRIAYCEATDRICIVGGEIGGAMTSMFLKHECELNDLKCNITMLEKSNAIGGRIRSLEWKNETYELGASILHDSNYYMKTVAAHFNFTTSDPSRINKRLAIHDGENISFQSVASSLFTAVKMLWRYGLWDFLRLRKEIGSVATRFARFYEIQHADTVETFLASYSDKGLRPSGNQLSSRYNHTRRAAYHEVGELLGAVDLSSLTQQSIAQYLSYTLRLSNASLLLHELVAAAVRVNYNQPLTVNALAGAVGIIPLTQPVLFAVHGGNEQVPRRLIERYVDNLKLEHIVRRVVRTEDGAYLVQGDSGAEQFSEACEVIVFAAPLELANVEFVQRKRTTTANGQEEEQQQQQHSDELLRPVNALPGRRYKRTVSTYVEGQLINSYFGLRSEDTVPGTLLTSGGDTFSSVGAYRHFPERNTTLFKVFSHERLSKQQLEQMFTHIEKANTSQTCNNNNSGLNASSVTAADFCSSTSLSAGDSAADAAVDVVSEEWAAYPTFSCAERFASFTPFGHSAGVYYVNAFESAVSCMECMAVAAKNVAILAGDELTRRRRSR